MLKGVWFISRFYTFFGPLLFLWSLGSSAAFYPVAFMDTQFKVLAQEGPHAGFGQLAFSMFGIKNSYFQYGSNKGRSLAKKEIPVFEYLGPFLLVFLKMGCTIEKQFKLIGAMLKTVNPCKNVVEIYKFFCLRANSLLNGLNGVVDQAQGIILKQVDLLHISDHLL